MSGVISQFTTPDRLYLDFYNLKEPPFSITPDPSFFYLSDTHQSVLEKILYGITSRLGFVLLIGEVGTGKTTICRCILDTLGENAKTVYIINPSLSGKEIISTILDDLGVDYQSNSTKKDLICSLNNFLLSTSQEKPVVIVIDDAQTMSTDTLENLRLLSNLETDKMKLIQMVLIGQPELVETINLPEMRQLKQRIAMHCRLEPIRQEEVEQYISRRLFIAGDKGRIRFGAKAIKMIYQSSGGVPRILNKICDYALLAAYISNNFSVEPAYIKKALKEMGNLNFYAAPHCIRWPGAIRRFVFRWLPSLRDEAKIASSSWHSDLG